MKRLALSSLLFLMLVSPVNAGDHTVDTLAGAAVGGLIGDMIGGKKTTIAGAFVGGLLAHDNAKKKERKRRMKEYEMRSRQSYYSGHYDYQFQPHYGYSPLENPYYYRDPRCNNFKYRQKRRHKC